MNLKYFYYKKETSSILTRPGQSTIVKTSDSRGSHEVPVTKIWSPTRQDSPDLLVHAIFNN